MLLKFTSAGRTATARLACLLLALFFCGGTAARAAGFMVSPGRVELPVKPGFERTFPVVVDFSKDEGEAGLPNLRIAVRTEDWTLDPEGGLRTAPAGTLARSATPWLTLSTTEFVIAAGTKQVVRVTVTVPPGTPAGDYYAALYVEDRDPPPPPKEGERRLNIRYRFYSLVYVMVPELTRRGELKKIRVAYDGRAVNVNSLLANGGNSHLRPVHSFEVRDEQDRAVARSEAKETTVLLGGSELSEGLSLKAALPPGKYKLIYQVDFGESQPVQAGQYDFEVTTPVAEKKPAPQIR